MDQNKIPKTSVIITTFNDAGYLSRSISSGIKQSLKPLEIIVIDDGSDDDEAENQTECQTDRQTYGRTTMMTMRTMLKMIFHFEF